MAIVAACLCIALAAPVPTERVNAEKVVGTWKLVKSSNSPNGLNVSLEMELARGGKIILRQSSNGGPIVVYEGEYTVVNDTIPYAMKLPNGRGEKKETLTIKKLTETELHVVDPMEIQEDFERVKKVKKNEKQ